MSRDFLPEEIRKYIGRFRAEALVRLNKENDSVNVINDLKADSMSNNVITVDIGGNISDQNNLSNHEPEEMDEISPTNNAELTEFSNKSNIQEPGISNSEIVQYQSRYGRAIKTNTAKYIHSDFQNEIVLELDSDNEDEEDVDMEEVSHEKDKNVVGVGPIVSRNKFGTGKLLCKYCDRRYHHLKARNKHMISEHLDKCQKDGIVFQCELCGTNFVSAIGKSKHMKRVHNQKDSDTLAAKNEEKDFLHHCPFEGRNDIRFQSIKELKDHIKENHPDKDKSCIGCGLNCDTRDKLMEHIQEHKTGSNEARNLFTCEHCQQKFLSEYIMLTHKRNVHSLCETLSCEICGKEFKNSKFLANHIERHRKEQKVEGGQDLTTDEFICQLLVPEKGDVPCGKTFKLKNNLERHIKTSHMNIKQHQCTDCGKKFVDSTRLKEHRWIHTDHRPIKCTLCEKGFRHQNHLRHHMAKIHGKDKEFSCHICPKKFVYNYQLKTHLQTHSQSKAKLKRVQQNLGQVEGTNETALVINMDSGVIEEAEQTNVDPYVQTLYQCSLCQHVFQSYKALQVHCAEHSQDGGVELKHGKTKASQPIDIAVLAQGEEDNQVNIDNINEENEKNQLVLEISSEDSCNKESSSMQRQVSLPLDSLEGTIIKEQDGQQYYVVYDVPATQPIIQFEK